MMPEREPAENGTTAATTCAASPTGTPAPSGFGERRTPSPSGSAPTSFHGR